MMEPLIRLDSFSKKPNNAKAIGDKNKKAKRSVVIRSVRYVALVSGGVPITGNMKEDNSKKRPIVLRTLDNRN